MIDPNLLSDKARLSQHELAILESELAQRRRSMGLAYVAWFFLGGFGVHRYYLGHPTWWWYLVATIIGIFSTIILIGFLILLAVGIVLFIDIFRIPGWTDTRNATIERETIHRLMALRSSQAASTATASPLATVATTAKAEPATKAMKKCPDCAEMVLEPARICRYCRYEFWTDGGRPVEPHEAATSSSPEGVTTAGYETPPARDGVGAPPPPASPSAAPVARPQQPYLSPTAGWQPPAQDPRQAPTPPGQSQNPWGPPPPPPPDQSR